MVKIRKAKRKESKELADILRIESAKKPYCQEWSEKTSLNEIKYWLKNGEIYVAEIDGKLAGFLCFEKKIDNPKKIWIGEFWLKSQYQRQGIGKKILSFLEEKCRKKGFTNIQFFSHEKSGALKFYKKLNYKIEATYFQMDKRLK